MSNDSGRTWLTITIFLVVIIVILGFSLVGLNIKRVDLAYELKTIKSALAEGEELQAKLEVERNKLVSPHQLRSAVQKSRLTPAEPGQIRKIDMP